METSSLTPVLGLTWLSVTRFILAERAITVLTRGFDVLYVALMVRQGLLVAFVVVTPLYFMFCAGIVGLSRHSTKRGIDLFGIDTLRALTAAAPAELGRWRRIIRWILMRRASIFWIGSVCYLDPDYVTLLLQKSGESMGRTLATITLPSVVLSQVAWGGIYWLGYQGFTWASWLWEAA